MIIDESHCFASEKQSFDNKFFKQKTPNENNNNNDQHLKDL